MESGDQGVKVFTGTAKDNSPLSFYRCLVKSWLQNNMH
jgi:hypothetical protein